MVDAILAELKEDTILNCVWDHNVKMKLFLNINEIGIEHGLNNVTVNRKKKKQKMDSLTSIIFLR